MSEHPRSVQILLVVVVPIVYGAITGYFLGVSESAYLVLSVLGILGGLAAGYDHVGARAGARRGIPAGALFGISILVAHEIHGESAKAHLPEPAILLVALTTILAIALAAVGGWLRERSLRRAQLTPDGDEAAPAESPPPAAPRAQARPAAPGAVSLTSGSFEQYRDLGMSVTQAKRVIAFRDRDGFYRSVDDLDLLPGFSREFCAQLKRKLSV